MSGVRCNFRYSNGVQCKQRVMTDAQYQLCKLHTGRIIQQVEDTRMPQENISRMGRKSRQSREENNNVNMLVSGQTEQAEKTSRSDLIKSIRDFLLKNFNNLKAPGDMISALSTVEFIVSYDPGAGDKMDETIEKEFKNIRRGLDGLAEASIINLLLKLDTHKLEVISDQIETYGDKLVVRETLDDFRGMHGDADQYVSKKLKSAPGTSDLPDRIMDLLTKAEGITDPALLLRILIAKKISRSRALIFIYYENPRYQPVDIMRRILSDDQLVIVRDAIQSGEWKTIYQSLEWDKYLI